MAKCKMLIVGLDSAYDSAVSRKEKESPNTATNRELKFADDLL